MVGKYEVNLILILGPKLNVELKRLSDDPQSMKAVEAKLTLNEDKNCTSKRYLKACPHSYYAIHYSTS